VTSKVDNIRHFLPLKPLDYQVLTVLGTQELHGYGIVQAAQAQFPDQPSLELGSLYRIIGRMLDQKLISEVPPPPTRPDDRKVRRYYTITDLGLRVVRAEATRMRALLAAPASRKLEARS
jgi:DNA-binding PadR family transcriptional regulator